MPDNQIEVSSNGKRFFKVSASYVAAVSSILGIIIFCGGWIFGYMTFKADMGAISENGVNLRADIKVMQERQNTMNQTLTDDRQTLTNQITILQTETKYISQGVAELKLADVPKR